MTIKTKLQLTTILSTLAALAIGLMLFAVISSVTARSEELKRGTEIIQKSNELRVLMLNRIAEVNPTSQAQEKYILEWSSKYEAIDKLLAINFEDDQRQILLKNIRQNYADLQDVFKQNKFENTLSKLQLVLVAASQLDTLNQSAFAAEDRMVKISFFLAIALLMLILATISYFTRVNIVEPLSKLAHDAKIISKGKLKYKINLIRNDEIGNLAKSFSYMVSQLKVLNEGLEEKVLRRTSQLSLKIDELEKAKKNMDRLVQNLQQLNAKDKIILSSMGEGMVITDQKGIITFINKTFENMFDLKIDLVKGKNIFDFIAREKEEEKIEQSFLFQSIETGKSFNNIFGYIFRKGSKKIPLGITVSALVLKGKNTGSIILLHDRSKEKELQDMKEKFLAFVADQLRTPLGSMRWNIEMLMESQNDRLTPEVKQSLQEMHENNQRILELVNQLLDVSDIKKDDLEERIKKLSI